MLEVELEMGVLRGLGESLKAMLQENFKDFFFNYRNVLALF